MLSLIMCSSLPWLLGNSEANGGSSLAKREDIVACILNFNLTVGFICSPASLLFLISSCYFKILFHNITVYDKWPYSFLEKERI